MKNLPKFSQLSKRYRVVRGERFRLKDWDPADTLGLELQEREDDFHRAAIERLSMLQDKLFAQDRWAVLLIFQAVDAGGKDSAIRHVMSGVNPQGCEVRAFKQPSAEDLSHNFLWRASQWLPSRGHIGIFNRSYYEEVLVTRVHPEVLAKERIPQTLITKKIWEQRFEDISSFERHLYRDGLVIRKFFLNVSKREQRARFLHRLEEPDKNWKFSADDVRERDYWDDYMDAYEDMIRNTADTHAPWYIVPADQKWFTRMVVASVIVETLESLDLSYPKVDAERRRDLQNARRRLLRNPRKTDTV
jgi:PPK2 family polyphosphate:nucleotide phosphotransferase